MPSFKKGTINIGERQTGRLKSSSVIDVVARKKNILKAIKILYSKKFQKKTKKVKNLYGSGGASKQIASILKKINLKKILIKKFYDVKNV
jgi:UDP-N-acetylglucosamine 2-epimerase